MTAVRLESNRSQAQMHSPAFSEPSAGAVSKLPFGALAYFGAGASLFVCYGKVVILGALSAFGFVQLDFNPHLQAVLMWSLGAVAIFGLYRDRSYHGMNHPVVLGAIGVFIIVATLYTHYDRIIEVSGYILLVVAALLNQNARLSQLNREVESQARILSRQAGELEALNQGLEERVSNQVDEIEKLARLKRFLAPEVAQIVLEDSQNAMLESHRSYIVALFCDIRGFTRFSESMEPEEVMQVLQQYHENMGRLSAEHGGTIDHRAGDGLMVFFNDPLPCDEPEMKAVELALEMRDLFNESNRAWLKQGYDLGFGIGVAAGYATLGLVGYQDRYDYTANGNVVNLASRLCDEAGDGQILLSSKTYIAVEDGIVADRLGDLELKGIFKPVPVYDLKTRC
jgi:class 3 adenylate cyclase